MEGTVVWDRDVNTRKDGYAAIGGGRNVMLAQITRCVLVGQSFE